jgi:hypothetical protein
MAQNYDMIVEIDNSNPNHSATGKVLPRLLVVNVQAESYSEAFNFVMHNPSHPSYGIDFNIIKVYNNDNDIWWMVHDKGDK